MTALDLPAIRALHAGITPGPWRWDESYGEEGDTGLALTNNAKVQIVGAYNHHCCSFRDDPIVENEADAAFIAAAPSIVTQLLAKIDAVEAELAATEQRTIEGWGHGGHAVVSVASIRAALTGEGQS